jgi:hypothetical protein
MCAIQFLINSELYNYQHNSILEHFNHPQRILSAQMPSISSHSRPQTTINLLSISTDLPFLDILYKWNHEGALLGSPLWLACFWGSSRLQLVVHSISFYCFVKGCTLPTHLLVVDIWVPSQMFTVMNMQLWTFMDIFLYGHVFNSWVDP